MKKKCPKCGGDKEVINLQNFTKKDLNQFNKIEAQGWVINSSIIIEGLINDIIFIYFQPNNSQLFITHVLNSSIMHFGGKLKVLHGILGNNNDTNDIISKLQKLGSIRNSFAHINNTQILNLSYKEKAWHEDVMNVMNSKGIIKSKNTFEFLTDFLILYQEMYSTLRKKHLKMKEELLKSK